VLQNVLLMDEANACHHLLTAVGGGRLSDVCRMDLSQLILHPGFDESSMFVPLWRAVSESCLHLQHVRLGVGLLGVRSPSLICRPGLWAVLETLDQMPLLCSFDLSGVSLSQEEAVLVMRRMRNRDLRDLYLSDNDMHDLAAIVDATQNSKLCFLDLADNNFGSKVPETCVALCELLSSVGEMKPFPLLLTLDLSRTNLDNNEVAWCKKSRDISIIMTDIITKKGVHSQHCGTGYGHRSRSWPAVVQRP
jgi:hypothetical protein